MLRFFFLLSILSLCSTQLPESSPKNVITVPPNCPEGQEWVNGACRDIWRSGAVTSAPSLKVEEVSVKNVVTVPPNCPPGQKWINGKCRDIWQLIASEASENNIDIHNMITVRPNCLPGQQWINGQCRDVWSAKALADSMARNSRQAEDINVEIIPKINIEDGSTRNVISVPNQCPEGYKADALGICRKIL